MLKFHTLPDAKPANLSAIVLENDICTLRDQIAEMGLDLEKGKEVLDTLENAIENIRVNGVDDKNVLAILNGGQALEQMCQCKFEELTAEKALEALDGQEQGVIEKMVAGIKEFFRKLWLWLTNLLTSGESALEKIKNATGVQDLEGQTYKLIRQGMFENYVKIIEELDKLSKLSIEDIEKANKIVQNELKASLAAVRTTQKYEEARLYPDDQYGQAHIQSLQKRSDEILERLNKLIQETARIAEEGPGWDIRDHVYAGVKKLAEEHPDLLAFDENSKSLVMSEKAVAEGTCASLGYNSLEVIKRAAEVYEANKNTWKQDADVWGERVATQFELWFQSKLDFSPEKNPGIKPETLKSAQGICEAQIAQLRVIMSLQRLQLKVKAEMVNTLKTLANRCVTATV